MLLISTAPYQAQKTAADATGEYGHSAWSMRRAVAICVAVHWARSGAAAAAGEASSVAESTDTAAAESVVKREMIIAFLTRESV
jgi:hypothetical protein